MTKTSISSPIGEIVIICDTDALVALRIAPEDEGDYPAPIAGSVAAEVADQLDAYFDGRLRDFTVPLAPLVTPRGQALREAMIAIPFGETLTYGLLAQIAGSAPRAIGQACARNPLPIVVPCHRVLSAGGKLGFYSGGKGPATKAWLLDHENGGRLL